MSKFSIALLFIEINFFCIGLFSGSGYFVWSSLLSLIVYRVSISTIEYSQKHNYGISPIHLYKIFWYFLLVISPLSNNIWKPPQFPLPFLPTNEQNNYGLLIITFAAFASALGYRTSMNRIRVKSDYSLINPSKNKTQPKIMILIGILGIGLLLSLTILSAGLKLSFASLTPDANSLPKFLSIILPPFLTHGLVLRMSNVPRPTRRDYLKFIILVGICTIPFTLYRLNRASIFVPLLAIIIPLLITKSKLSSFMVWLMLVLLGGFAVQGVGNFRAEQIVTKGGQISLENSGYRQGPSFKTVVFNYLNSSEYVGYGLQEINRKEFSVLTPLYSLASPLPKLSRLDERKIGGTGIYNRAIYQKNVYDQICSTVLEVFLSWGFVGLSFFFFVQGRVMQFIQRKYVENLQLYPRFFLAYVGFWIAFTPSISISVLTQLFFYNFLFIVIFLGFFRFRERELY